MGNLNYHKCLVYQHGWLSFFSKKNRVEYVKYMLGRYPKPKDWDYIKFSNKIYFEQGPKHQLQIIQKTKKQYCIDCIQHNNVLKPKDEKCYHCWTAVGYNFKLDISFYNVLSNTNDKMSF